MSIESITSRAVDFHRKGDYDAALKLHLQALHLLEETVGRSHDDMANRYRILGSVMDDAGKFEKAKDYFERAIQIYAEINTNEAAQCRGEICQMVGNMMYKAEDYQGAYEKLKQAKEIIETTPGAKKSKLEEIEYLMEVASMMMD